MTIQELVDNAHRNSVRHGWWDNQMVPTESGPAMNVVQVRATIPEKLCLIHSEVSEALECYRDGMLCEFVNNLKPEGLPTELADVVIRVADLCGALGIDLEQVLTRKMAYNADRPYRHGGKVA